MVFADTGSYLWSGWSLLVPHDRPIIYGLFLRWTSFGATLWLPIAIQALLTAWAIRFSLGPAIPAWITPVATGFLALTTGLAPHAGLLIPDIFTALGLLTLARLLTAPSLTRGQWLGLGALLALSVAVHMSHLLMAAMLVLAAAALTLVAPRAAARAGFGRRRGLGVAGLLAAIALLVPTVHRLLGGGFVWTRYSHVFTMARMAETGILSAYLHEACPTRHYRLCGYQAVFPMASWKFLWVQGSPLELTGGGEANRAEYREIIGATLRKPRFLAMHIRYGIEGGAEQLVRFTMPVFLPSGPETPAYEQVRRSVPGEFPSYQGARQRGSLSFPLINALQPWVVLLSLAAIGAVLGAADLRRRIPGFRTGWTVAVLLGVIANAVICGALSSPSERYGARLIWVIPLTAIALLATIRYGSRGEAAVRGRAL